MSEKTNHYPLTIEETVNWFRAKEMQFGQDDLLLAAIRENTTSDKPSAYADFDTASAMGRISVWVSGEIDFEVLRISDGKSVLFHHEDVSTLDAAPLQVAYDRFVQSMKDPDENPQPYWTK